MNLLRRLRLFTDSGYILPADQAAQSDLAAAQESEEQEQNRHFAGERGLGFGPPAKLFVYPLQRVGGAQRLPL